MSIGYPEAPQTIPFEGYMGDRAISSSETNAEKQSATEAAERLRKAGIETDPEKALAKALNLWIENTVNNWQKFQAMNPARKPKQDKDAMKTIKDLEARVTTLDQKLSGKGAYPPKPFEHIFCDLKTYKQTVYGGRAGEMMFTDFKSKCQFARYVRFNSIR